MNPLNRIPRRRVLTALAAVPALVALAACGSGSGTAGTTGSAPTGTPIATATSTATSSATGPASSTDSASAMASGSGGADALVPAASPDTTGFPVTLKGANGTVTLAAPPTHIVSLSPTATEMLFQMAAGGQVVAVDNNSTWPATAPITKLSAFEPNAEAIAGYKPDLVVLSNDANGLLASLQKLKVPALLLPAVTTLDEAYGQMTVLGQATGHTTAAAAELKGTQDRMAAALASVPASAKGRKVYHEVDQTYYSVTSSTFLGSVYKSMGLTNIADGAKGAAQSGGYPQLSAEYVVTQAPDLIVLADTKCCQQSPDSVAKRPGFAAVPAVKNGQVLAADDDIASRWGPRIADFAESVAAELTKTG